MPLVVAFSAILPLMTVVNYSMQDTFGNNQFFWNGVGWFKELLDPSTIRFTALKPPPPTPRTSPRKRRRRRLPIKDGSARAWWLCRTGRSSKPAR